MQQPTESEYAANKAKRQAQIKKKWDAYAVTDGPEPKVSDIEVTADPGPPPVAPTGAKEPPTLEPCELCGRDDFTSAIGRFSHIRAELKRLETT